MTPDTPEPAASPTLEHLLGRALGAGPAVVAVPRADDGPSRVALIEPHRCRRRPRSRAILRARPGLAIALVVALALGWIATSRVHHESRSPAVVARASARHTTNGPDPSRTRLRRLLPRAARCRDASGSAPEAQCALAGVEVDYRLLAPASTIAAYRAAIGGDSVDSLPSGPRSGPPACARGAEDERSWSRPSQPKRVAGRYACRLEHGTAALWWTEGERGLLAHAVAPDADLASLFGWWLSHSER